MIILGKLPQITPRSDPKLRRPLLESMEEGTVFGHQATVAVTVLNMDTLTG